MRTQTKYYRLFLHAKKKLNCIIHGLRLSGIKGRISGPKVILNSIPKAGTNLLENVLMNFPLLRNPGKKTIICWDNVNSNIMNKILEIKKGEFWNAHLPCHDELIDLINLSNIKMLLMIRDPRDIVVSNYNYCTYINITHPTHEYFCKLLDDDERLMAVIKGVPGILSPIEEVLAKFSQWIEYDFNYVVKFENIIGEKGGGNPNHQIETILEISDHLQIKISNEQLNKITNNIFSIKSPTFRKGKIGGWQNYFKKEHIVEFKKRAGSWLIQMGYEDDLFW